MQIGFRFLGRIFHGSDQRLNASRVAEDAEHVRIAEPLRRRLGLRIRLSQQRQRLFRMVQHDVHILALVADVLYRLGHLLGRESPRVFPI